MNKWVTLFKEIINIVNMNLRAGARGLADCKSGLTHFFLLRMRTVTAFAECATAASGITLATRVDDTVGLAAFPCLLQKWSNVIPAQTVT